MHSRRAHRRRSQLSRRTRVCAPGRGSDGVSCFTHAELRRIANAWNVAHPHATPIRTATKTSKAALWHAIDSRMRTVGCASERCWVSKRGAGFLSEDDRQHTHVAGGDAQPVRRLRLSQLDREAFLPRMPAEWKHRPTTWLSTLDIEAVMRQYQQRDPTFRFVGAVPIDFASPSDSGEMGRCVTQALCQVRLKRWWREGVRRMGIVFNLDRHTESGSHWVSAFFDFSGNGLYYYDSFGDAPSPEVRRLFAALGAQLETHHGSPPTVRCNTVRHQFRNTECGMYSIYFLVSMLRMTDAHTNSADAFAAFLRDGRNDRDMQRHREVFFDALG